MQRAREVRVKLLRARVVGTRAQKSTQVLNTGAKRPSGTWETQAGFRSSLADKVILTFTLFHRYHEKRRAVQHW